MIVCSTVIARLISELESGKSSGPEDISLESLKFIIFNYQFYYYCVFLYDFHMVTCHLT